MFMSRKTAVLGQVLV